MEGLSAFVLDRATIYPSFSFNEKSDKLDVSIVWPSHTSHELQRKQISDVNVGLWLNKESPAETEAPALLRLLWVRLHKDVRPWQFNIRRSSLYTVLENFNIMEAYKYGFTSPGTFAMIPVSETEHPTTLVFSLCMPDLFAVAWKYDVRNRRTEAVFWADDWISETMQDVMSRRKEWARHPFFLAILASVMLEYLLDRDLDREVKSIAAVENRTKYHGFKHTSVGVAEGDFASLSQRMSGCAVSLAGSERIHKVLDEFLVDISFYSQRYGVNDDLKLGSVNLKVDKCVETLKKRLKMQKIQIDYLSRRVGVQLTAVCIVSMIAYLLTWLPLMNLADSLPPQLFNLIAQKEAKVGIAVAEDSRTLASASKEDSTAMKTLAGVTVVFLPGTFVAALFAMPLFEWNAVSDNVVVLKRFWVYWAVTIPLTCLTLVAWVMWTRRQAWMNKMSDKRAREELWVDIEGEKYGGVKGKEEKL